MAKVKNKVVKFLIDATGNALGIAGYAWIWSLIGKNIGLFSQFASISLIILGLTIGGVLATGLGIMTYDWVNQSLKLT